MASAGRLPARKAAKAVLKNVTAVNTHTPEEARVSVFKVYKNFQRRLPDFWFDQYCTEYPLPVFREVLKKQFVQNAHINDLRIIDRKVEETYKHIEAFEWGWYNPDHVKNYLLRENIDAKPKDFLSKFLQKID